jgi:hypothetical protein
MKLRPLLLVVIVFLACPKKYAPKVEKIEAIYLSSLYEDIHRDKPILAGVKDLPGIKIGYIKTDPPFMAHILKRLGFYQVLNEFPIDFVITELDIHGMDYFTIPVSMGYAIKNYEGIRFAILCKNKDSLAIEDEIKLSLIKQRSDILWVIDNALLNSAPKKIDFFVKNRELSDTSVTAIMLKSDTVLLKILQDFRKKLRDFLNSKIHLEGKNLDEYILSKIAQRMKINVILYPDKICRTVAKRDSISIQELLNKLSWDLKFKSDQGVPKTEILKLSKEKKYNIWGKLAKTNQVLLPAEDGTHLFDLYLPLDAPQNR